MSPWGALAGHPAGKWRVGAGAAGWWGSCWAGVLWPQVILELGLGPSPGEVPSAVPVPKVSGGACPGYRPGRVARVMGPQCS